MVALLYLLYALSFPSPPYLELCMTHRISWDWSICIVTLSDWPFFNHLNCADAFFSFWIDNFGTIRGIRIRIWRGQQQIFRRLCLRL